MKIMIQQSKDVFQISTNSLHPEKQRVLWIDSLKGFTIIFVVLGHVLFDFAHNHTYPASIDVLQLARHWVYSWHMPVFFVLSGITFRLSKLQSHRLPTQKIGRSTLNLLLIYLIFQVVPTLLKFICSPFLNNTIKPSRLIKMIFFTVHLHVVPLGIDHLLLAFWMDVLLQY